jgi:NlpC/P60 family putative phage cell wall peptidase
MTGRGSNAGWSTGRRRPVVRLWTARVAAAKAEGGAFTLALEGPLARWTSWPGAPSGDRATRRSATRAAVDVAAFPARPATSAGPPVGDVRQRRELPGFPDRAGRGLPDAVSRRGGAERRRASGEPPPALRATSPRGGGSSADARRRVLLPLRGSCREAIPLRGRIATPPSTNPPLARHPLPAPGLLRGVGCDCLGLVRGVWRALYGAEPEPRRPIARTGPSWAARAPAGEALDRRLIPLASPPPARATSCCSAWRPRRPAKHCAIRSADDRMIHAYWGRACVESWLGRWWRERLVAAFRFPESEGHPMAQVILSAVGTAVAGRSAARSAWHRRGDRQRRDQRPDAGPPGRAAHSRSCGCRGRRGRADGGGVRPGPGGRPGDLGGAVQGALGRRPVRREQGGRARPAPPTACRSPSPSAKARSTGSAGSGPTASRWTWPGWSCASTPGPRTRLPIR